MSRKRTRVRLNCGGFRRRSWKHRSDRRELKTGSTAEKEQVMKYILMMSGTKANFEWFTKWSKKDLEAHFAFMHAFNKELQDAAVLVAAEGLAFPDQAKLVRAA